MEPPADRRLPLRSTITRSLIASVRHLGFYARVSWAWALLTLPCMTLAYWWIYPLGSADPGRESAIVFSRDILANVLLPLPMLASTAVAWHRLMIQDQADVAVVHLDLGPPVRRYILIALAFQLLILAPVLTMVWWFAGLPSVAAAVSPGSMLVGIVGTILVLLGLVVTCRLSLMMPATAIDAPASSPQWAWHVARGATWRLLVGSMVTALAGLVPWLALAIGADELLPPLGPVAHAVKEAISSLLSSLLVALPTLAFLSLGYKHLVPPPIESRQAAT